MNPVHTFSSYFLKTDFNVILTSAPRSLKWTFSFRFPSQISVCMFLLQYPHHILCLIHLDLFVLKYKETWVVLSLNLCLHGFYAHFLFVLSKLPEKKCYIFLYLLLLPSSITIHSIEQIFIFCCCCENCALLDYNIAEGIIIFRCILNLCWQSSTFVEEHVFPRGKVAVLPFQPLVRSIPQCWSLV